MDMSNEELAKVILGVRSGLGAGRDDLMDESDERKWDALTEAAARLRQQAEDSARLITVIDRLHEAALRLASGKPVRDLDEICSAASATIDQARSND